MSPTSSPASTEPALSQLSEDHPAQAYGALPARELLNFVQIASNQLNDREAQTVFTAFYYRYFPYLYTVVSNSLGVVYDRDAQQEIIDDVLAAFFRASHKLTLPAAEVSPVLRAPIPAALCHGARDPNAAAPNWGQICPQPPSRGYFKPVGFRGRMPHELLVQARPLRYSHGPARPFRQALAHSAQDE
jgi:hypothetical protein